MFGVKGTGIESITVPLTLTPRLWYHMRAWLWIMFFSHQLINQQIIKTGAQSTVGGEWGSIFKNNRTCFWTGVELLLQTMGLAHLSILTVNQWAGTHIQTGYFCCCGLVSCCLGNVFVTMALMTLSSFLSIFIMRKPSLFQVFGSNSDLFDMHVE